MEAEVKLPIPEVCIICGDELSDERLKLWLKAMAWKICNKCEDRLYEAE